MPKKRGRMSKSVKKRIQRDNMWYETGMVQAGERAGRIKPAVIKPPKLPKARNGGG